MPITTREARDQILDDLAVAVERLALAVACLGDAYEQLSVTSADRLEAELYRPAQRAFGRAMRTHSRFAALCGADGREFEQPPAGRPSQGVRSFVERTVEACGDADRRLSELQDSMLPIEFGDAELRSGLAETRELLAPMPTAAREFLRTLGR